MQKVYSPFRVSMCIWSVFFEFSLKINLFPFNSVLHRNSYCAFFPRFETAVTLKSLVVSECFYPQVVDLCGCLCDIFTLLVLGANLNVYFRSKLTAKVMAL
jgi:hypothetical protein